MSKIFFLLAMVACASAQGNVNSYSGMRNALLDGSELQINVVTDGCEVTTGTLETSLLLSMPMKQWQLINDGTLEAIRSDDFYISTTDLTAITVLVRHVLVFPDNSVTVTFTSTAELEDPIVLSCALGDSATAHRVIPGNDLEEINSYQEVKSLLLAGDHVEAVGNLRQCRNSDEVFPNGEEYIVGYQIQRFQVINDGTDSEYIIVDDVAVVAADGGQLSVGTEALILLPDETVFAVVAVFTPDLQPITNFTLECDYDNAIKFHIHERENPSTYTTYAEIKEATLDGHDMEAIVFLELCEIVSGEATDFTGQIASARFDEFQLFEAGGIWGDLEYIAYSTYGLTVDGTLFGDVLRVREDESVEIEAFVVANGANSETAVTILSCPLLDSTIFHSVPRTRAPVQSFTEIVTEIQERGQTFEVEIDYNGCDTGDVTFGSTFGGIVWQTYVDPSEDGFYFGNVFSLVNTEIDGTPTPVWNAAGIILTPGGNVTIIGAGYDYFTGANVAPGGGAPIECQLATAEGGSVYFFRYP